MGQLERYGLYVLCVVIVGILGIAIWGGQPAAARRITVPAAAVLELDAEPPPAAQSEGDSFFDPVQSKLTVSLVSTPESEAAGPAARQGERAGEAVESTRGATAGTKRAARALPQSNAVRTYTVVKGDTMEEIAIHEFGGARYVEQIRRFNPGVDPKLMRPGDVLVLPWIGSQDANGDGGPSSAGRSYTVRENDTVWDISVMHYGTGVYTGEILEANGISEEEARNLTPGRVLEIPPLK